MMRENSGDEYAQVVVDVDRVIHEPARLALVAHLYVVSEADFIYLEQRTKLTRGNLSSHLRKLEEVGYIAVEKDFVDRIPRTVVALTDKGRKAFDLYRQTMLRFLRD